MALAVAQLVAALEDPDAEVRCAAAKSFARGVCRGDPAAVELLAKRTEDTDEDVRLAAVEGLVNISAGPNEAATTAVLRCLQDSDEYVRRAAVTGIGSLAAFGDKRTLEALVTCLHDDDNLVRDTSVDQIVQLSSPPKTGSADVADCVLHRVLEELADKNVTSGAASFEVLERLGRRGDATSLDAALACASSTEDDDVRTAAIRAVKTVSEFGNTRVMTTLKGCLQQEEDVSVRCAALNCLASLAPRGDQEQLLSISACLVHSSQSVREAALEAMSGIAGPGGSTEVCAVIRGLLLQADADPDLECSVLKALTITAAPGDTHTLLPLLESRLTHEDCDVRRAAVEAVGTLGPDDAGVFAAIVQRVSDDDEDVRCSAIVALGKLPETGRDADRVIAVLTRALEDDDRDVRREAATVLAASIPQGREDVISPLGQLLQDEDESVRTAAVHSFISVAGAYKTETQLKPLLIHADPGVRCTSLTGLGLVADPQDGVAVESVAALLEDSDEDVRDAAGQVLALFSKSGKGTSLEAIRDAVIHRARHGDAEVRISSLQAAMELHPDDPIWRTRLLLQTAEDPENAVRLCSCRLLADLKLPPVASHEASSEDGRGAGSSAQDLLLSGCMVWLADPRRAVQQAGIQLLAAAWPEGCEAAAQAARFRLAHQTPQVRRAALECYLALTVPPDGLSLGEAGQAEMAVAKSTEVAARCLVDGDERVRSAAVQALGVIVRRCAGVPCVDAAVLQAITPSLEHQTSAVRCSGAEALASTGERGDESRTALLVRMTQDADEDVRWSSLGALAGVAKRGCRTAVQAARTCTKDEDEQIRIAAVQTLAQVAEKGDTEVLKVLKTCLDDTHDVTLVATTALISLFPDRTAADALSGASVV